MKLWVETEDVSLLQPNMKIQHSIRQSAIRKRFGNKSVRGLGCDSSRRLILIYLVHIHVKKTVYHVFLYDENSPLIYEGSTR